MIGSSVLTFWYEVRGRQNKDYDLLAREIAATITVNKSLAVVFGVAPLLSINVLYTLYFYSANAITGNIWISIVPWVAVSFLLFLSA
jgi:cytochrome c